MDQPTAEAMSVNMSSCESLATSQLLDNAFDFTSDVHAGRASKQLSGLPAGWKYSNWDDLVPEEDNVSWPQRPTFWSLQAVRGSASFVLKNCAWSQGAQVSSGRRSCRSYS